MKKVISVVLALCIVLSVNITAFATTKTAVERKIDTSAAFLISFYKESGFTAASARTFEKVVNSGVDVSAYKDAFIADAADALASTETPFYVKVQIMATLEAIGEYPASFSREKAELMMTLHPEISSPYYYLQAIALCDAYDLEESAAYYADALCGYYVMGTGAVFWGDPAWMSGDDIAMFAISLAPVREKYSAYIEDALTLLATYRTDGGYYNSYTGANADTTALVLAAFSAYGDQAKADEAYNMLVNNFYDKKSGGFLPTETTIATDDAILGLEYYRDLTEEGVVNGWEDEAGDRFYYEDGVLVKGLKEIEGNKYIFAFANGAMLTGKVRCGGKYYIMSKADGTMLYGKVRCDGKYYIMSKADGTMLYGKVSCDGKGYIMSKSNGQMLYGKVSCDGKTYICSKSDGHIFKNMNVTCNGVKYYCNSQGVATKR